MKYSDYFSEAWVFLCMPIKHISLFHYLKRNDWLICLSSVCFLFFTLFSCSLLLLCFCPHFFLKAFFLTRGGPLCQNWCTIMFLSMLFAVVCLEKRMNLFCTILTINILPMFFSLSSFAYSYQVSWPYITEFSTFLAKHHRGSSCYHSQIGRAVYCLI